MGTFVRRVETGSGATAVQIVHKRGRRILSMDRVGSARDEVELALLLRVAQERMHAGQEQLRLGEDRPGGRPVAGPVVTATPSLVLWEAMERVYADLGFDAVMDEAFKQLVLGRIIEPTSKIDTIRVLDEVGRRLRRRSTGLWPGRCSGSTATRSAPRATPMPRRPGTWPRCCTT